MFNKNDPLVDSVRLVMEQSARERQAAQAVNEAFGITDRKALPHERYAEWDAAYRAVLSEGVEALNEELKGNQHEIDVNKNNRVDAHDFKLLRLKKKKTMQEASLESIQEEIAYNLLEQAEYIYENHGEEALREFYENLSEEQREIVEGMVDSIMAGARGAWNSATLGGGKFVRAGADYLAKKAMGKETSFSKELDQEREKDEKAQTEHPTAYAVGDYGATAATLATGVGGIAKLAAKGAMKAGMKSAAKVAMKEPSKVGKAIDSVSSKGLATGGLGHVTGVTSGKHKGMSDINEGRLGFFKKLLGFGDDGAKAASGAASGADDAAKAAASGADDAAKSAKPSGPSGPSGPTGPSSTAVTKPPGTAVTKTDDAAKTAKPVAKVTKPDPKAFADKGRIVGLSPKGKAVAGGAAVAAAAGAGVAMRDNTTSAKASDPTNTDSGERKGADASADKGSDPTNTDSGAKKGADTADKKTNDSSWSQKVGKAMRDHIGKGGKAGDTIDVEGKKIKVAWKDGKVYGKKK